MLVRFFISSFTCRFLFSSLESVVKSNVTVFVFSKRKQKQLSVQFWSFCLRANGPVNYKQTAPLKSRWFFFLILWFDVHSLKVHSISFFKIINAVYLPHQNKEELDIIIIYVAKLRELI